MFEELEDRFLEVESHIPEWTREILEENQEMLLELMRTNLFRGKGANDEDLRPYYSEDLKSLRPDGFFTSPVKAENYALHKIDMTYPVNVDRNPDAPNLYISGKLHDSIGIVFDEDSFEFRPQSRYAEKIMQKYGMENFTINSEDWELAKEMFLIPRLKEKIKEFING